MFRLKRSPVPNVVQDGHFAIVTSALNYEMMYRLSQKICLLLAWISGDPTPQRLSITLIKKGMSFKSLLALRFEIQFHFKAGEALRFTLSLNIGEPQSCCIDRSFRKLFILLFERNFFRMLFNFENVYWWAQMYFDDLPIWGFIGKVEKYVRTNQFRYFLFSHIHFDIMYNANRVIDISVSADPQRAVDISDGQAEDVSFSYSVKWTYTKLPVRTISAPFKAEISVGSPRKLFIFII